jgi:Fe2+ or Zn2+ uptake regulation protein
MMADTFESMIEKERERLTKNREQLLAQQKELEALLDGIGREMEAITAYEGVKTGKPNGARTGGRRGGRRNEILALLKKKPMARKDLLLALKVKGDQAGERSVSNALTVLTKIKKLKRSPDRRYRLV